MDYYTYLKNMEYLNQMQCNFDISRVQLDTWPLTFQSKSTQYLINESVKNIKEYIMDERSDELFYDKLISLAPDNSQQDIIMHIRDDEKIHGKIFRKIFNELTGVVLPVNTNESMNSSNFNDLTYMEGLKKAFMGELEAVRKYREIMAYMPNKGLYNMFLYVITDELSHADKYNYLITINK